MNICNYTPTRYLDDKGYNDRFRLLFKNVCYLLGQVGTHTNIPDATVDFSVNTNPNTVGTTFSPNTPNLTTVIYVSTIDGSQWTSNGTTYTLYVAPYWAKTGNSGTNPATNFIGTTDNNGLKFKINNVVCAYFNTNNNISIGKNALNSNTTGNVCEAFGSQVLFNNTTGNFNLGIGLNSLYYNISGSGNTAIGQQSLLHNTTGSNNLGIGNEAGEWNTTGSNQIFINSISRSNYIGDQTGSPIYIQQNATVANQKIYLNGLMNLSYVPTYANNAAAITGGLVAGNIYKINNSGTYTLAIVV